MKMEDQRCVRCTLPQNWGITKLDKDGVCNYCRYYDTVKDDLRDFERWQKLFADHLDVHKGKYAYDVVVGFSGGKDSSYIIHQLKSHYNCKVLAVTVNFGFMPTPFAIENSRRVAKSLGIDHIVYDATFSEIQNAFKAAIKGGRLCGLCTALCSAFTRKIAVEKQIPFHILGADRGQLLRDLAPEVGPMSGARTISKMLTPYSVEKTIRKDNPQQNKKVRGWLSNFGFNSETIENIYPEAKPLNGTKAVPLNLQYFLFHPYNEKEIKHILTEETDWQLPDKDHLHAHHDCDFHDAATYYFREAHNTTITNGTNGEIAVDVREGTIKYDEAMQALKQEEERLNNLNLTEPYAVFQEYFEIPAHYLHAAAKRARRQTNVLRNLRKVQMIFMEPKLRMFDQW